MLATDLITDPPHSTHLLLSPGGSLVTSASQRHATPSPAGSGSGSSVQTPGLKQLLHRGSASMYCTRPKSNQPALYGTYILLCVIQVVRGKLITMDAEYARGSETKVPLSTTQTSGSLAQFSKLASQASERNEVIPGRGERRSKDEKRSSSPVRYWAIRPC